MKDLYGLGVRRIGVFSTLPLGCLPGARAAMPLGCAEVVNQGAQLFNSQLSSMVDSLKNSLPGANMVFINVYDLLRDLIDNPNEYGKPFLFSHNLHSNSVIYLSKERPVIDLLLHASWSLRCQPFKLQVQGVALLVLHSVRPLVQLHLRMSSGISPIQRKELTRS